MLSTLPFSKGSWEEMASGWKISSYLIISHRVGPRHSWTMEVSQAFRVMKRCGLVQQNASWMIFLMEQTTICQANSLLQEFVEQHPNELTKQQRLDCIGMSGVNIENEDLS